MPKQWLWVSRDDYLDRSWSVGGIDSSWSCAKDTKEGDRVLMYEAGARRFLWRGVITSDAESDRRWDWVCDFRVVGVFDPPIALHEMTTQHVAFKEWGPYRAHFQRRAFPVPSEIWNLFPKDRHARVVGAGCVRTRAAAQQAFDEGFRRETLVNRPERSRDLVEQAKIHHGTTCMACGFCFGAVYGEHGDGFVEMHHVKPVSRMKPGERTSVADVLPLCANCHRMIHRGRRILSIRRLRSVIAKASPK